MRAVPAEKFLVSLSPDRRQFLAAVGSIAASWIIGKLLVAQESSKRQIPVGVQLWTLRKEIAEDLPGTLKQVAAIGHKGVELWFQQWPEAKLLKRIVGDLGLQITSAHVNLTDLKTGFNRIADYHQAIGNTSLVIPYIPNFQKLGDDDWRRTVNDIRAVAERGTSLGFQMLHHNHDFEFLTKVGDVEVLDLIFGSIDAKYLKAEIDVFFAAETGRDPAKLLEKFSDRVKFVHLKEKPKPGEKAKNTELGRGVIDWSAVFTAAQKAGVEWYLVEQNCEDRSALDSIRVSFEFLKVQGQA